MPFSSVLPVAVLRFLPRNFSGTNFTSAPSSGSPLCSHPASERHPTEFGLLPLHDPGGNHLGGDLALAAWVDLIDGGLQSRALVQLLAADLAVLILVVQFDRLGAGSLGIDLRRKNSRGPGSRLRLIGLWLGGRFQVTEAIWPADWWPIAPRRESAERTANHIGSFVAISYRHLVFEKSFPVRKDATARYHRRFSAVWQASAAVCSSAFRRHGRTGESRDYEPCGASSENG